MVKNLLSNNICNHIKHENNSEQLISFHHSSLIYLYLNFFNIFLAKLHNVALYCYSGVNVELRGSSGKEE
jgi:hypothetical protein